jgi:hypothetical protein
MYHSTHHSARPHFLPAQPERPPQPHSATSALLKPDGCPRDLCSYVPTFV